MSENEGRAAGILLHPTSLPGPAGIGDLGPAAHAFLGWLREAGQRLWQVLPLGPTGYGDSPYATFSCFAGNPLLVSLETLAGWGLLRPEELRRAPVFEPSRVDFGAVMGWKNPLLGAAARRFTENMPRDLRGRYETFRVDEAWWLDDYCLFAAIKHRHPGAWNRDWPREIALREAPALARAGRQLDVDVESQRVIQFFFFAQWEELRAAAVRQGVSIIGDIPIFAALDSADVWAHRDLFLLDAEGRPTVVSGVPPDYFAATGQLWGNPLYDWEELARQGFRFWVDRIRAACRLYDFVRVDHFRGFDACWSVPASEATAEKGTWVQVPGRRMFETLEKELGELPIIAEDLGVITPPVVELRERFGFPGMRILQFAFDKGEAGSLDPGNRFLPHNHERNSIVYTGTHDNDTTAGWFGKRSAEERAYVLRYTAGTDPEIPWCFIRMAMSSVCRHAVIPLQDVLGLGSEARMNTPGTSGAGNWCWRAPANAFAPGPAGRLHSLAGLYGRDP
jgi:4-alpha-glucanotransferase